MYSREGKACNGLVLKSAGSPSARTTAGRRIRTRSRRFGARFLRHPARRDGVTGWLGVAGVELIPQIAQMAVPLGGTGAP
jgi:hypothetical protein